MWLWRRATIGWACAVTVISLGVLAAAVVPLVIDDGPAHGASTNAGGLHVAGNRILDRTGSAVVFKGVNRSGTEYACVQGWGIFDGPSDARSVAAMTRWHINIVRIPLNEDCWLGINGIKSRYAGANYRRAIVEYVTLLHRHGIDAELSLMWGAPGTYRSTYQSGAPDEDHAPAVWASMAKTFRNDPDVILAPWGETIVDANCFLEGGVCEATYGPSNTRYRVAGMQQAVTVMRGAGYDGIIAIPGIGYANDLSQWLSHMPWDPRHQLIAEAHVYGGQACDDVACFRATYAPVARRVPLIFGEVGESFNSRECGTGHIATIVDWADAHRVGVEAWAWDTWRNCGILISNYAGRPFGAYGAWIHAHYLGQAAVPSVRAGAASGAARVSRSSPPARHARWAFLLGREGTIRHSGRDSAGAAIAFRFRDQTPGVARTLSVYVRSGSMTKRLIVGLYSDRGSDPGTRLVSSSGAVRGSGWLTLALRRTTIVKGQTYWIALLARRGTLELAARRQRGCHSVTERTAGLGALPRAWKPGSVGATCVSAYASGSRTTSTPPNSPPRNTSPPQISGTAEVGAVLTASVGSWTGNPTAYSYQWRDCSSATGCADIAGATGSSDTVQLSDQGDTMDVVVTASDAYGSTSANSARTQIVATEDTGQSVTFWLAWSGQIQESQIPWNAVTQVDLFSLTTTTDTSGCSTDCTSLDTSQNGIIRMNVPAWVSTIHKEGKLAMISIGGSTDQDWVNACAPGNLPGFTRKLISYMVSNGFDGVDIDIESLSGSGSQMDLWAGCEQSIAQAAHAAVTQAGGIPIVSADVDQSWMDSAVAEFEQWPDQFNLMYYGYPTGSYSCANSCSQVNTLVQSMHTTGHVPYDRMVLGMSPGGSQDQCCYVTLGSTAGSVDTSASVTSIPLSSGLSTALPAGNLVLASTGNPPAHYEIFATSGAAEGATAIPITGEVVGSGAYTFASRSAVQSDYAGPWDCGNFAGYAAANGLEGVMIWDLQEEAQEHGGQFPCFAQVAPYVGSSP
jgi:hypothetical protein